MNSILDLENNNEPHVLNNYRLEIPEEQAKITGVICIGCAAAAVFFAFFSSLLSVGGFLITIYLVFLLLTAAFGLLGYSEINAAGAGWTNSVLTLFSIVLLFVSFLCAISGKAGSIKFGVIYGVFVVLIPILLTILSLAANKVARWKAFVPLAVPLFHVIAYPLLHSVGLPFGLSLLPLGWGLLGMTAYQGRK